MAALTLPSIIQKQQEKVTVTKLKKVYSVLQQSYMFMESKYGSIDTWTNVAPTESSNGAYSQSAVLVTERFVEHNNRKVKVCGHGSAHKCGFTETVKNLGGRTESGVIAFGYRAYWTAEDASFGLAVGNYDCNGNAGNTKQLRSVCGNIFADINGNKPPNTFGKDIFVFHLTKYGIIPNGTQSDNSFKGFCNLTSIGTMGGYGCTAWVIYNENLDYLRCNDLSWIGKKKCK